MDPYPIDTRDRRAPSGAPGSAGLVVGPRLDELRDRSRIGCRRPLAQGDRAGAGHLRIEVGPVRVDEKHLRSIEFDVARGRYRTVITVKSRGEVTLVGPFRRGGDEGPCRSFPIDADVEIETALGEVLERFLEEATTP